VVCLLVDVGDIEGIILLIHKKWNKMLVNNNMIRRYKVNLMVKGKGKGKEVVGSNPLVNKN